MHFLDQRFLTDIKFYPLDFFDGPQRSQNGPSSNCTMCDIWALLLTNSYVYFSQKNSTDKI